jgi:hypothetical protein
MADPKPGQRSVPVARLRATNTCFWHTAGGVRKYRNYFP